MKSTTISLLILALVLALTGGSQAGESPAPTYTEEECCQYVTCPKPPCPAQASCECPEPVGQPEHRIELFAGAGALFDDRMAAGTGWLWTAGLAIPLTGPALALQAEYTGSQQSADRRSGNVNTHSVLAGPRLRAPIIDGWPQLLPHAEFLTGWTRVSRPSGTSDHLGVKFGGGLEYAITDQLAVDLAAHYMRTVTDGSALTGFAPSLSVRAGF